MMALILLALGSGGDGVSLAIERAVIERMGDVQVVVRDISTTVVDQSGLVASIEPGSRLGQPIRFVLTAGGKRRGSAVARLEVVGAAARARRGFARDEEITAADIEVSSMAITNVLVRRMPKPGDVVGTRARRDIMAGELLTSAVVDVPPAIRAGDEVQVTVRMKAVQVSGTGRASGSGQIGDTIRVTTTSSRKSRNARVVGRGAVEIVQ